MPAAAHRRLLLLGSKTTYYRDTVNRPDSTTSIGQADTGQLYTVDSGTFGISSNRIYPVVTGDQRRAWVDIGKTNYRYSATVRGTINSGSNYSIPSLIPRYVNLTNYLLVYLLVGAIRISKIDNGSFSALTTFATTTADNTDYILTVAPNGNNISVSVDNVFKGTYTLSGADAIKYGAAGVNKIGIALQYLGSPAVGAQWSNLLAVKP